jgi:hypothetical protein
LKLWDRGFIVWLIHGLIPGGMIFEAILSFRFIRFNSPRKLKLIWLGTTIWRNAIARQDGRIASHAPASKNS